MRRSWWRLAVGLVFVIGTPALAAAQGWTLDWWDDFDGPGLNTAKWTAADLCDDQRNEEEQCYAASAVSVVDGNLVITATRDPLGDFAFTSGAVRTDTTFAAAPPVRIEFRAKLPPGGYGIWPALWLFPNDWSWPPEIDVLEAVNDMRTIWQNYHWGTWSETNPDLHDTLSSSWLGTSSSEFHTYAVEWEPDEIRWYVDGQLTKTLSHDVSSTPMQLYINLALGGTWPGPVSASTVFPQTLLVDWVRVYTPSTVTEPPPDPDPTPDPTPDPVPDPVPEPTPTPEPDPQPVVALAGTVTDVTRNTTQSCSGWGWRRSCTTVALDEWTLVVDTAQGAITEVWSFDPAPIAAGDGLDVITADYVPASAIVGQVQNVSRDSTQACSGWGRRRTCTTVYLDSWTVLVQTSQGVMSQHWAFDPGPLVPGDPFYLLPTPR